MNIKLPAFEMALLTAHTIVTTRMHELQTVNST